MVYRLVLLQRSFVEMNEIFELSKFLYQTSFAIIVMNQFQNYITNIYQKNYVLLQEKTVERKIQLSDVLSSVSLVVPTNYKWLNRSDWVGLWSKKVDYFEYQKPYIQHKYPILYETLDYYIGLAENAISYVREIISTPQNIEKLTVARRREMVDMNSSEFFSPLNIVLDYSARDLAEYLKSAFFADYDVEKIVGEMFQHFSYQQVNYGLLMGRLLFPSFYFDPYEQIVNGVLPEKVIYTILKKSEDYEYFLQFIYQKIHQVSQIPRIDWLEHRR